MVIRARDKAQQALEVDAIERENLPGIIWQGALVELFNPKTILFFALFLPPFVSSDMEMISDINGRLQLMILGILVPLTALPSDLAVAFLGGTLAKSINRQSKLREYLAYGCGLVLIGIAISLQM